MTKSLDPVALREVYDAELRAWVPAKLPPQASIDHDGPVLRVVGLDNRGFVTYRSLAGLTGAEVRLLEEHGYPGPSPADPLTPASGTSTEEPHAP